MSMQWVQLLADVILGLCTKMSTSCAHTPLPFQDIFRKYPSQYESIISTLCENLDSLDEPEARCVLVRVHQRFHPCSNLRT